MPIGGFYMGKRVVVSIVAIVHQNILKASYLGLAVRGSRMSEQPERLSKGLFWWFSRLGEGSANCLSFVTAGVH